MRTTLLTLGCFIALSVAASGCKVSMNSGTASPSPAAKAAASAPASGATKTLPAAKTVPVPANWITMSDEGKGYSFQVPEGTEHSVEHEKGMDIYIASTPAPTSIGVLVIAFKDPSLTKADLIKSAVGALEGLKAKNVKIGDLTELSPDYSLATYTALNGEGKPVRGKVLVGTDVTDNYVMLVGAEESEYKANEKVIDEIWGSFTIRSGGASGKS